MAAALCCPVASDAAELELRESDHVVFLGNTFAERMQHFGYFEATLHYRYPEHRLVVRNMGWSADEVALMPRPLDFGDLETHLTNAGADVIFLCFGMNESFRGDAGLDTFGAGLEALIQRLASGRFNGESAPRLVLVSPIAHENLGNPWPDPAAHNANLANYTKRMAAIAEAHRIPFADLFQPTRERMAEFTGKGEPWTINGIHLNERGYAAVSRMLASALGIPPAEGEASKAIRELVVEKDRQFFFRWRPVNAEYVFGRRKEPFGVLSYPPEMAALDRIIADLDEKIWAAARATGVKL